MEAREARDYPKKVKLSVEKPGSTFWFPDEPRYKQVGLFTFEKVKAGVGMRRATSRLAALDIRRLVKAQWSAIEARVKVSVTWHRRGKYVIFVRLQDFFRLLLTEDPSTQNFILQVKEEGKVVMWHRKSLSEEQCDHVDEEQKNNEESEHITAEGSEINEEQADGDRQWNTKDTEEEYVSFEEEVKQSLSDEEYVTDEADDEQHSNTEEEYVSIEEEVKQSLSDEEYVTDEADDEQYSNTEEEYISCNEAEGIIPDLAFQEDAIEKRVEEEEEAFPQEPHVKDAATEDVPKERKKRQKKRKPRRAKADVGLMSGVMHVHGQDPDAPTEGWAVVTKKKRPHKQKALPPVSEEKALQPVEVQAAPAAPKKATSAPRRNTRRAPKTAPNSVRASWKKEVLDTTLAVAPHQRRCIVGPRSATLKQVLHEFPGVRVMVPPPLDAVTDTLRVRGPPQQVAGTVARLKALLHRSAHDNTHHNIHCQFVHPNTCPPS